MATLTLKGIQKSYGTDAHILKGIDLEVSDGEFLVLVGPSGCGKSTLLRMIAGLETITAGDLYMDGIHMNAVPPKERDLAMVFQSYALYPHMTVRQNMGFSLSIRKVLKKEIRRKVNEAANLLELDALLDRYPKELSGGQRQRVAIGRAIVRRPKIFLLDEPLSNLDANLRGQMRIELKKLHHDLGATMIYVTHDQIEAMTLADRICVLEGGYARQVDKPLHLYKHPASKFVASFIGSPPMNFIPVSKNENYLIADGLSIPCSPDLDIGKRTLLAGIRPHELRRDPSLKGTINAKLLVTETVGWDLHLHLSFGSQSLIAQVPSDSIDSASMGDSLTFHVDPKSVLLFDTKTHKAIDPCWRS